VVWVKLVVWVVVGAAVAGTGAGGSQTAETLRPVGGLSQRVCDALHEPIALVQARSGRYLLLDRRAHTVYAVDRTGTQLTKLMEAGLQKGEVLQPAVLSLGEDDGYAITDAPFGQERIQVYTRNDMQIRAFLRPGLTTPRLTMGPLILNGVGSLQFTGSSYYINAPESGALVTELDLNGDVVRHFGVLRRTGQEHDRNVHLALNIGLALPGADGSVTFVFQTGVPQFRKYDATGALVFERHIEGSQLDPYLQMLPTTWPTRTVGDGTYPIVSPTLRTAALDPEGNLWVSLVAPYTYVYDRYGDKRRTVQFDGTSGTSPVSLSFSRVPGPTRALVLPGCYAYQG
jgi:hypothetical protein